MHLEEDKPATLSSGAVRHMPVMLDETVDLLNVKRERTYVDVTAGAGGHLQKICQLRGSGEGVIALDRDLGALERLRKEDNQLSQSSGISFVHSNFTQIASVLSDLGINTVDGGILADRRCFVDAT